MYCNISCNNIHRIKIQAVEYQNEERNLIVFLVLCLCGCEKKSYTGEIDAVGCHKQSSGNCYESDITVVANRKEISNYEEFAWEVLEHYITNDFQSVLFDFKEEGYPYRLKATIYLHVEDIEAKEEPVFKMIYESESGNYNLNIKDDPENFTMKIIYLFEAVLRIYNIYK